MSWAAGWRALSPAAGRIARMCVGFKGGVGLKALCLSSYSRWATMPAIPIWYTKVIKSYLDTVTEVD